MRIVARLLVLLPLLSLGWGLCSSAHGAEQVDQIRFVRAVSKDTVDALRESDPNTLGARSGDVLVLRLAVSGPYEITIDEVLQSSLGNTIIKGTTPSGGASLMVLGADGSVRGHFERPQELVQVSRDERGIVTAWVEGVDAEMLPINDDGVTLAGGEQKAFTGPSIEKLIDAATSATKTASSADVSYARFKTGQSNIPILIYYQDSMIEVGTIADYLIELTNLAFQASGVSVALTVAAMKPVDLEGSPLVTSVFYSMLNADSPFEDIAQDMSNHNAVMAATIIGSASPAGETAGGIASIGSKFSTGKFSVTRYRGLQDGYTALYPSDTFAHEIGHNLGANHNRETFSNNGDNKKDQFSYAFGYLIEGVQRTIMSYTSAAGNETGIPHYSNPSISYDSRLTGIPTSSTNSAFVARAFTNNRHVPASKIEFGPEALTYRADNTTGADGCGIYRAMALSNESSSNIAMHSANYVGPDGSVTTSSLAGIELPPGNYIPRGFCRPESDANPLGTTYTESFFRYYHPANGELTEGPRFQWSETYIPLSEVRIAYTDGGKPIGNTARMVPLGGEEEVVFEPARGFSLGEIKSTCEGSAIAGGFRVKATVDPCIVEASFLDDRTPPARPTITGILAGDGVASISVSISDDGGADITSISADCTWGSNTCVGESATSPVLVSGMLNGQTYICSARATNIKGTGAVSDAVAVTLNQTMPSAPTIARVEYGDREVRLFVDDSSQPTTVDSYTAHCSDGTNSFTGTSTSSPITVSGLTNDVAYTCTVTASNSVGQSLPSAATPPITPEAIPNGLPVWLLYEASK